MLYFWDRVFSNGQAVGFLGIVVGVVMAHGCGSRPTPPRAGKMTAAEFASVLKKAGVELEKGTTLVSSYSVVYCREDRASAYIGYVQSQYYRSEFALVLEDTGRVALQERGIADAESGGGAYFVDWEGNGRVEFVWRTDVGAAHCTRVIEVAPGAPCALEVTPALGFYPEFIWDEADNGILTYKRQDSGAQVTFTLQRNPFRLSVSDPSGALKEGWTISGPWAKAMSTTTSASTSAPSQ